MESNSPTAMIVGAKSCEYAAVCLHVFEKMVTGASNVVQYF